MAYDVVIRGGTVVDGTGGAPRAADVAIAGERIVEIGKVDPGSARVIDAEGCFVTPGFVDIHTHLDAQVHWDPLASSASWHGVTSVVMGNCGVTFAPCKAEDRQYLARLMESVEDIPASSIMDGLGWDWETYGEFLGALDRLPKGINYGGLVGHCALRIHAMGERGLHQKVADPEDVERMCALIDEAMAGGALGFSTSRLLGHRTPEGESIPGTFADEAELFAFARVLGGKGRGVYEVVPRFEGDPDPMPGEVDWMLRLTRETGRPVTFGYAASALRRGSYRGILEQVRAGNQAGAQVFPQTQVRQIGFLFGLQNLSPWDRAGAAWEAFAKLSFDDRLAALRSPERRRELAQQAEGGGTMLPAIMLQNLYVLGERDGGVRYDFDAADALGALAKKRGLSLAETYLEISLETEGEALFLLPIGNANLDEVAEMLSDANVVLGLADSGAHCGQIMDASLPTFLLSYWVRERELFPVEEAVRKLTSELAAMFDLRDRGVLRPGAFADLNVVDLDALKIKRPEYVRDFPLGAGRYIQRAEGYRHTLVNGAPFLEDGAHTGAHAGRTLRSTD